MEPNDQPEPDSDVPVVAANTSRRWWKAPLTWIHLARDGIKWIFGHLKKIHHLPGRLFSLALSHKLIALTVFASLVAILLPVQFYFWYRIAQREREFGSPVAVEQIYDALERGDYAQTKILAKRLLKQKVVSKSNSGVAPYALGAVAVYEAEKMKGKARQTQYLLASRYLDDANSLGFPESQQAVGSYLYGKSLFEIGEFVKCRPPLIKAMKDDPRYRTEIYPLLSDAYLNDSKPNLAEAMSQNQFYLDDANLSQTERQFGLLQKARIELRMDKLDDCRATLAEIPEISKEYSAAMIVAGQVLMREAELLRGKEGEISTADQDKYRKKYQEAVKTLRHAESLSAAGSLAMRQSMYLIGVCFMQMGDSRAANDQFIRLYKIYPETPEGAAACLQEAEIDRRAGHEMEMLSSYRRVLGGLDKAVSYSNPWITPEELKSRLSNAYQQFQAKQQFEICQQMIGLMKAVIPADQTQFMKADLHTKWAQYLAGSAEKVSRNKREPMRRLAREQYRRAGQNYVGLAKLYLDKREYSDQIWNASIAYLQGHNYARAASLMRDYMETESQKRRPQALDCLGESLLNMGEYGEALDTLKECIELFPRDAAACHARLLAAQAAREKGEPEEAERMLLANLNGDYLTPASKEWRDSLFLLSDLLHDGGQYAEATRRLEEAVKRYPDLPETIQARYLLADSCCRLAYAMLDELKKDVSGSSKPTQMKLIRENLDKARAQYDIIREKLGNNRDLADLSPLDKAMLRNSIFAIGDAYYAEEDYESAIKAYYIAANRYQNRPEVLDAYVQIANAYRRLGKQQDANNALLQAKLLLNRMKPDVPFESVSIYSREQWSRRLEELRTRS